MSLSVIEATQIGKLKNLHLVAGKRGLNRIIETIGILDHEILDVIHGKFGSGDFVLTTFTAARNNESLLISSIKKLIACNVTGLAIKKVFYQMLPNEIISYANRHDFPIFMYDDSIFTEDIISDLSFGIKSRSNIELMSSKIDILFKNDLKKVVTEQLAIEINPYFYQNHIVIYLKEKLYVSDDKILRIIERYNKSRVKSSHHSLIKYNEGVVIILTYKKISESEVHLDLNHIVEQYDIDTDKFVIGKSSIGYNLFLISQSIKESIYAAHTAEVITKDMIEYKDIGIYKFLLPHKTDHWIRSFTRDILTPICNYDDGKLRQTAEVYIENKGDILKTATQMFQHKNTIRYRIKIMQTLTAIDNISDFYEQLSIAIKFEKLTL